MIWIPDNDFVWILNNFVCFVLHWNYTFFFSFSFIDWFFRSKWRCHIYLHTAACYLKIPRLKGGVQKEARWGGWRFNAEILKQKKALISVLDQFNTHFCLYCVFTYHIHQMYNIGFVWTYICILYTQCTLHLNSAYPYDCVYIRRPNRRCIVQ